VWVFIRATPGYEIGWGGLWGGKNDDRHHCFAKSIWGEGEKTGGRRQGGICPDRGESKSKRGQEEIVVEEKEIWGKREGKWGRLGQKRVVSLGILFERKEVRGSKK